MATMTGRFQQYHIKLMRSETCEISPVNLIKTASLIIDITKHGDEWTISTEFGTGRTKTIRFTLGQEFDDTTDDDRPCRSTITQDGDDKLVHVQRNPDGSIISKSVWKFTATRMKISMRHVQDAAMIIKYNRM